MTKSFTWTTPAKSGNWNLPVNWTATSGGTSGTASPGTADNAAITGGAGTVFQIVAGPGTAAQLSAYGNNALDGTLAVGTLKIGEAVALPGVAPGTDNSDALDIDRHATVLADSAATLYSNLEIDGGALHAGGFDVVAGARDAGTGSISGAVVVVNGGRLQAGEMTFANGSLLEDASASVEVGDAGGADLGIITVDSGAILTIGGAVALAQAITDNGDIVIGYASQGTANLTGGVSGAGALETQASADLHITNSSITGLSLVHLAKNSTINFFGGAIASTGAITLDTGSTLSAHDLTNNGPITVGTGATLSIGGTLSGTGAVAMGMNSILDLSGQDTNTPVNLVTAGNITLNLSAGSDIGGAVSGFDSSDLIENRHTTINTDIINIVSDTPGVAGAAGTLTLLSETDVVTTIALAGNYAGQHFLTNFTGINYGDSDITLPGAFINGIGPGTQTVTGSAARRFSSVTGGGSSGALTLTANLALEGAYTAASLVTTASATGTVDATDIDANSSLSVTGSATVQTNLQLTGPGSAFTVGGLLTIGGGIDYFEPQIILAGTSRLRAANITLEGSTAPNQLGSNTTPDLAVLGASSVEIGSGNLATAGTIAIDPGATLTLDIFGGEIFAGTVIDDGLITMGASPQGVHSNSFDSSLSLDASVTGTGTLQPYGSLIISGSVTGLAINAAKNSDLTVDGAVSGLQNLIIGQSATVSLYSLSYAKPIEVGASASFSVGGSDDTGITTGITSLTVDANATAKFSGPVNTIGSITVAAGGTLEFDRTASGTGSIALGTGVTLTNLGQITGWTSMTLAGQDNLDTYNASTIAPTITGFDTSDQFRLTSDTIVSGGVYYTGATWTQGANNTGTLTLTQDNLVLQTYTLTGNYAGLSFITFAGGHVVGTGVGTSAVSLNFGTQAGLKGTTVTGTMGGSYLLLTGGGTQSALTMTNDVAVTGAFTLGTLQLGATTAPTNTDNAVLIEAGGILTASSATVNDTVEADGVGALFSVTNTITMTDSTGVSALIAFNGAVIQVGATLTSTAYDFDAVYFAVDKTGSIEVGHLGGAAAGKITVDAGSTLHSSSGLELDAVNGIVLNGTWLADNLSSNTSGFGSGLSNAYLYGGDITGTGTLQVGTDTFVSVVSSVVGLRSVAITGAGGLSVSGSLRGAGDVTIAAGGSITVNGIGTSNFSANTLTLSASAAGATPASFYVENNATGTGALIIGAHDTFSAGGTISGWSSITVGAYASLTINGAEQTSPITLGANTALRIGSGATISGVVTGFAKGDFITYGANQGGSPIITNATWTAGANGLGTLSLYSDSAIEAQITLAGNYANQRFLTNAAGEPGGTTITLADLPLPSISPAPPAANDFNGDGRSDVLLQSGDGALVIWTEAKLAVTHGVSVGNSGPTWHAVSVADFNDDGQPDLLMQNNDGGIVDYLMNGTAIASGNYLGGAGPAWHVRGAADFSKDGYADILLQNDNGSLVIWTTNGTTVTGTAAVGNPGAGWTAEGVADFNGDGQPDILLQNTNGALVDYLMDGTTKTSSNYLGSPGAGWAIAGTGDYNGDGKADILLHNDDGTDVVWNTNGTAVTGTALVGNPGPSYTGAAAGLDLNGDGSSDLVVQKTDSTLVAYTLDNNAVVTASAVLGIPGAGWHAVGNNPVQFIDGTGATANLAGTPGADQFDFTSFAVGLHQIANFDPAQDVVAFSNALFPTASAVLAAEYAFQGGTYIQLTPGSALVIQGITPGQLTATDFTLKS